jgi:acyl-CoA dehydrogenase
MQYDAAAGWLVGQANRGLHAMFTMMNEVRLGVGVQGLAVSEVAYQNAAAYAKERLQGRALSGAKFPAKSADPIIVHPDVRRNLMTIKAFNEAARALVLWTALQADVARRADDDEARRAADDHLGLLTPVIKGMLTDRGFANAVMAQQIYGGYGYIVETGMEQFVRDARIAMIYEGANGIQALDLVGRKLGRDGGRAVMAFFNEIEQFIKAHGDNAMQPYVGPLATALGHLQQATMWFMQNAIAESDNAGAGASSCSACCQRPPLTWRASRPAPRARWSCRPKRFDHRGHGGDPMTQSVPDGGAAPQSEASMILKALGRRSDNAQI